jgi:hypothetical protein
MAVSSLTVARQRGILTRFPVFTSGEDARSEELAKIKTTVVEESNGCPYGSQSHLDVAGWIVRNKTNRGLMSKA